MARKNTILSCLIALTIFPAFAGGETIIVSTEDVQLVYKVDDQNKLRQCYFGSTLNDDAADVQMTRNDAFPTFGTSYVYEPALRAVHADGNTSTELAYVSHTTAQEDANVQHTEITLRDTYFPFDVKLCFNAYQKENVIEAWTVISHNEKKPVMLYNYASSHLFFSEPTYYLTQFYGEWADEMKMKEMQLTRGKKVLESKLGVRSDQHAHACFLLGLDAPAQEDAGRVLGGTLAWPGSWNLTFDVDNLDNLHVICGINSFAGQYSLAKGEKFETPRMLYSYSDNGTGSITRNFHRWAKNMVYGVAIALALLCLITGKQHTSISMKKCCRVLSKMLPIWVLNSSCSMTDGLVRNIPEIRTMPDWAIGKLTKISCLMVSDSL